jgi:hypothetical protein
LVHFLGEQKMNKDIGKQKKQTARITTEQMARITTEQMARIINPRQRNKVTPFASSAKPNPRQRNRVTTFASSPPFGEKSAPAKGGSLLFALMP